MAHKTLSSFSEEMFRLIPRLIRVVFRTRKDAVLRGEITVPQIMALNLLRHKDNVKMKDIAAELSISLPAATGLINRMVTAGLVKRRYAKDDRRVVHIDLTTKGNKTLTKFAAQRKKTIQDMFKNLSEQERAVYLNLVKKILKKTDPTYEE